MTRKNGIDDLGNHCIVVPDNAGENGAAVAQFCDQVVAHFVFYPPGTQTLFTKGTLAQFAERARQTHDGKPPGKTVSEGDYTPLEKFKILGGKARLMNVAVSAGFLPYPYASPQVRQ